MTLSQTKAAAPDILVYMDSVEYSLVTCSPHEEIYSLYGHTAIRMQDLHKSQSNDIVYNWGVFNFDAPHFVLRFVFGLTDYELEAASYDVFCKYYQYMGSSVRPRTVALRIRCIGTTTSTTTVLLVHETSFHVVSMDKWYTKTVRITPRATAI